MDDVPKERPLAIDATAQSASPTEPAFIARPEGAPVYHGFVVLDDVTVDGFTLNKTQVGDMGIDGRIYPVGALPKASDKHTAELDFMDEWYPIQVEQMDRVGRPDIDKFQAAMMPTRRKKGFFVGFDFSRDTLTEIDAFFRREHIVIIPLTVREILDEHIAQKLA